jgi:hypothetical protein
MLENTEMLSNLTKQQFYAIIALEQYRRSRNEVGIEDGERCQGGGDHI